jgi:hypothetical protein
VGVLCHALDPIRTKGRQVLQRYTASIRRDMQRAIFQRFIKRLQSMDIVRVKLIDGTSLIWDRGLGIESDDFRVGR